MNSVEVEFQILGTQRDGLLLQLGQIVIAAGFFMLRQRIGETPDGVLLTMRVRGPHERLLQLEEKLGTHPMVRSFESGEPEDTAAAAAPRPVRAAAPAPVPDVPAPAPVPPARAPVSAPVRAPATSAVADMARIEPALPLVAKEYPHIFPRLLNLERSFTPEAKTASMLHVGRRVGAWVYRRDFALGAHQSPQDALNHVAAAALKPLVPAEVHGHTLRIHRSPFATHNASSHCCHFFVGYLEALLKEAGGGATRVAVRETHCRAIGDEACVFELFD